jgi:hypothetical protein
MALVRRIRMMNIKPVVVGIALWFLVVVSLAAEVMDKEPSVTANWMWAVVSGALAVLAWRWRWWLGALLSCLALAGIYFMYQEIDDPSIGPTIRREAGQGYITQFYLSAAVGCLLHVAAAYSGFKLRRAKRRRAA